jgi:hypothetical protein
MVLSLLLYVYSTVNFTKRVRDEANGGNRNALFTYA